MGLSPRSLLTGLLEGGLIVVALCAPVALLARLGLDAGLVPGDLAAAVTIGAGVIALGAAAAYLFATLPPLEPGREPGEEFPDWF